MSEPPRFFVGPEDAEINPGNYRRFFHHAEEEEEEEDESDFHWTKQLPMQNSGIHL